MREWRLKAVKGRLGELLFQHTRLPEQTVRQLLEYGAVVWRPRGQGSWQRIRDGGQMLASLDEVVVTYEPKVLRLEPFVVAAPIFECKHYGVWYKPAGIMSQGTAAGDQRSLLYAVEKFGHAPFLVHRLDRETEGPMLVAYSAMAAGKLSQLFQDHKIQKTYHAIVVNADRFEEAGRFSWPLDGKSAQTEYRLLERLDERLALLELKPVTGRLHQLRRHLELHGSGVWGDPKYGKDNKNREGMKLAAVGLDFVDPFTNEPRSFSTLPSFSQAR